jgi:hypothetical protein
MKITIYNDPDECRFVWEKMWPVKGFFDLWQVRSCFHDAYARPLSFHVVEENNKAVGFLALCWSEEEQKFLQFPGETWHGKTWLEQNRIIAGSPDILEALLQSVPGPLHLRYLTHNPMLGVSDRMTNDEQGYVFFPGMYDFSFENYMQSFSGKFRKKLKADLRKLEEQTVSFQYNRFADLKEMFGMSIESYGINSYFSDPRFYESFENLALFLSKLGMLRITTVMVNGRVAAVDMGAVWKSSYTLLAGGTNPEFPGIAKLINLHHMEWACRHQVETVDFLCGDFNWKERFHLTAVPLYELRVDNNPAACHSGFQEKKLACA